MRRTGLLARALGGGWLLALLACSAAPDPTREVRLGYRLVSPGVAAEMLRDNPDLVVLDVRPFSRYVAPDGHLARALSFPARTLDRTWSTLRVSTDETVMLYGGDDGSRHAEEAIRYLLGAGQRYLVLIDGGLQAWRREGFEVVVEDAPLSPARIGPAATGLDRSREP